MNGFNVPDFRLSPGAWAIVASVVATWGVGAFVIIRAALQLAGL